MQLVNFWGKNCSDIWQQSKADHKPTAVHCEQAAICREHWKTAHFINYKYTDTTMLQNVMVLSKTINVHEKLYLKSNCLINGIICFSFLKFFHKLRTILRCKQSYAIIKFGTDFCILQKNFGISSFIWNTRYRRKNRSCVIIPENNTNWKSPNRF